MATKFHSRLEALEFAAAKMQMSLNQLLELKRSADSPHSTTLEVIVFEHAMDEFEEDQSDDAWSDVESAVERMKTKVSRKRR